MATPFFEGHNDAQIMKFSPQYNSFKLFFSKDALHPEFPMQRLLERHNPIKVDDEHMLKVVD